MTAKNVFPPACRAQLSSAVIGIISAHKSLSFMTAACFDDWQNRLSKHYMNDLFLEFNDKTDLDHKLPYRPHGLSLRVYIYGLAHDAPTVLSTASYSFSDPFESLQYGKLICNVADLAHRLDQVIYAAWGSPTWK